MSALPQFYGLELSRRGRLLEIAFNRPEVLNAIDAGLHAILPEALHFAAEDPLSDVILLTGRGKAFSAGGDLDHMEEMIADPSQFVAEAHDAKRIVFALLDIEKPVVARVNGAAVGLGATLALFCDVIFAAEQAKFGDPHVGVGLVAGDGGAIIWPQLIGFARAKEYLLTGDLLTAPEAAALGLINHAVPAGELDAAVDAFCDKLLAGRQQAIRWTKAVTNIELRRIATAAMDAGIAYETASQRMPDHAEAVAALKARIAQSSKG
ncbi:enoyl-CoA hydratase/isomerase family protein [Sinisalibacter aestuarii]|uniref:Enoyl-CoA hydratase n=1 Tax=Sinisalibacter aestuarii TaxID=2949426 RepID=A0ABQ5LYC4_9RHOB|nr:enoyl-CoA hydratase/isomerase family protein [Sinisalibacter aestuarii]GKY89972.1 enoyl-CoA hydratase [Sinisalibacter aestuarii]